MRKLREAIDVVETGAKDVLAKSDTSTIQGELDIFLEDIGLDVEKDSQAYRQLAYTFLKAMTKAVTAKQQRQQGEPVDTPPVPDFSYVKRRRLTTSVR